MLDARVASNTTNNIKTNTTDILRVEVLVNEPEKRKKNKKRKLSHYENLDITENADIYVNLKKWKIKPQNDEGILVLQPRQIAKGSEGLLITDFILGKGISPKLGSKISINYEGILPDGKVFDSNIKRTQPFTFRKGTAQVIRGLDLGIEGMKIGGSREIIIPPILG